MDKKKAKRSQLEELMRAMDSKMGEGYSESMPMKKVTVAADSKEGLEKGLSKAQELMKERGLVDEMEKEAKEEAEEMEEETEEEDKSPEAIKAKIAELQAQLEQSE